MNVIDFLKENKSSMSLGLPIELQDLIDERTVYDGSYEGMIEFLECPGLEHVRNARFVVEDTENGRNCIVLFYVKGIEEYDDFDLRQFAYKMKRLEMHEKSFDDKLSEAMNQGKWNHVDDKLPEEDSRVLVCVNSERSNTKIDTDRMLDGKWVRWGKDVTNWMPLPELPNAKERNVSLDNKLVDAAERSQLVDGAETHKEDIVKE